MIYFFIITYSLQGAPRLGKISCISWVEATRQKFDRKTNESTCPKGKPNKTTHKIHIYTKTELPRHFNVSAVLGQEECHYNGAPAQTWDCTVIKRVDLGSSFGRVFREVFIPLSHFLRMQFV